MAEYNTVTPTLTYGQNILGCKALHILVTRRDYDRKLRGIPQRCSAIGRGFNSRRRKRLFLP